MSVVANVAINVDARGAAQKLEDFQRKSQAASKAADGLAKSAKSAGDAVAKAGKDTERTSQSFGKLGKAAGGALKALSGLRGVLASIGATAAVSKAFGDAQALALAQKRLARLTQEYGQFVGAQQEAQRLASKFEVSVTDTAGALGSLASRLGAQGRSLDDIVAVYEGLNSALIATGRSSTEAAAASYQLSQALGSGSLTGDELKTISETLPELLNEVAKAAGVSSLQIRELAKDGKLSADLIIQATKQLRDKYSQDVAANITATQKFQNALGGLSEAIGTELAPAITGLLKAGTEILQLFGKLPGPVKTLIAAIAGLTAAFIALAPAISAVASLLSGITVAGLIAAGPWFALAAGITAAAVALGSYQREAEKVAGAAREGGAADVAKARNLAVQKQQSISLLEQQRKTATGRERANIDRQLARARKDLAELKASIAVGGRTATPPVVPPTPTPSDDATKGGKGKAADQEAQLQARLRGLQIETQGTLQLALIKGKIAEAEIAGNKELAIRLQGEQRNQRILLDLQRSLEGVTDERERQALQVKALADLEAAGIETAIDMERRRLEVIKEQNDELFKRAGFTPQDKMGEGAGAFDPSLPDLRVSPAEQQMAKYRKELDELTKPINMAITGANAIGDAFGQAFQDIATGAKSTQEALADVFKGIGQAFIQMAAEIIAKQLAMIAFQTILKALGGGGSFGFSGAGPAQLPSGPGFAEGFNLPKLYAEGGYVTGPTNALIGEGGESEYVIPASKMPGALARYASGMRGGSVIDGAVSDNRNFLDALTTGISNSTVDVSESQDAVAATRASLRETERLRENRMQIMSQQSESERRYERERIEQMASTPGNLNIKYESQVINSVEYVTRDQAERMAAQSALRGRELAIGSLQNSVKTRKRVGIA